MSVRKPPPSDTWLNQARPAATNSIPAARIGLKPNRVTSCPAEAGGHDDRQRQRQVGEPGMDGAVAEHLLHVQGDEVEHREQGGAEQQPHHVRARQGPQPEDPEGNEGAFERSSDRHESR